MLNGEPLVPLPCSLPRLQQPSFHCQEGHWKVLLWRNWPMGNDMLTLTYMDVSQLNKPCLPTHFNIKALVGEPCHMSQDPKRQVSTISSMLHQTEERNKAYVEGDSRILIPSERRHCVHATRIRGYRNRRFQKPRKSSWKWLIKCVREIELSQ